jgi:hypothetical protein
LAGKKRLGGKKVDVQQKCNTPKVNRYLKGKKGWVAKNWAERGIAERVMECPSLKKKKSG